MAIEYVQGDMFAGGEKLLVHGCNAQGVMGSGVAAIVRRDFPKAYEDYVKWAELQVTRTGELPMGDVGFVATNGRIIGNAITQRFYGAGPRRYVSYDAVAHAMQRIDAFCVSQGLNTFAMPKIGAGLGGGDWNVIEAIVKSELKHCTAIVYVLD